MLLSATRTVTQARSSLAVPGQAPPGRVCSGAKLASSVFQWIDGRVALGGRTVAGRRGPAI
eukprot:6542076-Lingulodinium_polyedra.AAC.1